MTSRLSSSSSGHKRTYNFQKRQTDCTTATLYKAPTAGQVIDSAEPLTVAWDTTCFNTNPQTVDLRLYAPDISDSARLQIWKEVPYAPGSYQVKLFPRWWNDTEKVELRFLIQESGNPFSGYYGLGPKFTATYTPRTDGKVDAEADMSIIDTGYTWVKNFIKGLSGGQIAAAVICPLIFIALVVGTIFYVRRSRKQVEKKRQRFSTMVDKRMSTISTNWQSMSAAGAQAAIRNSMATFGRPSADVATLGHESHSGNTVGSGPRPQQTRARSGTRVSFAPESMYGRPSNAGESVRTSISAGPTRSYHFGDAPPIPTRKGSGDENLTLSPTQQAGAFTLSAYEIDNRASQYSGNDVQPALQMMREADGASEPMFVAHDAPLPPVPAATATPKSPLGMMPMMGSALSPDAGLREYAARKQAMSPATQMSFPMPMSPTLPSPAASRTLYSPQGQAHGDGNPFRKSLAPTVDSGYDGVEDDVPRRF